MDVCCQAREWLAIWGIRGSSFKRAKAKGRRPASERVHPEAVVLLPRNGALLGQTGTQKAPRTFETQLPMWLRFEGTSPLFFCFFSVGGGGRTAFNASNHPFWSVLPRPVPVCVTIALAWNILAQRSGNHKFTVCDHTINQNQKQTKSSAASLAWPTALGAESRERDCPRPRKNHHEPGHRRCRVERL